MWGNGIKIVSDGSMFGTRVYSSDGEDLTGKLGLISVHWEHNVRNTDNPVPIATLTCQLVSLETSKSNVG